MPGMMRGRGGSRRAGPADRAAPARARENRLGDLDQEGRGAVATFSPGFRGRPRSSDVRLPPGQYETFDFPVLSAGPTPRVSRDTWQFTVTTEAGTAHAWSWTDLMALPSERPTVDLHCVTKWSKFGTH